MPALLLVCAVAMICVCFSGCLRVDRIIPGSDTADDSYMSLDEKLRGEDYGYSVTTYTVDQMTNNEISGLQARVTAEKTANGEREWVAVWYFTNEEYAIRWYGIDSTGFLKYGLATIIGPADAEEAESGEYSGSADVVYSRQGRAVVCGTADAYADAMS